MNRVLESYIAKDNYGHGSTEAILDTPVELYLEYKNKGGLFESSFLARIDAKKVYRLRLVNSVNEFTPAYAPWSPGPVLVPPNTEFMNFLDRELDRLHASIVPGEHNLDAWTQIQQIISKVLENSADKYYIK